MRFSVTATCGAARVGTWRTGDDPHQPTALTPACLLYTRRGVVPHLTKDLLDAIPGVGFLHLSYGDVHHYPGSQRLETAKHTLAQFLSLEDHTLLLSLRSLRPQAVDYSASDRYVTVHTPSGRRQVTPTEFIASLNVFQPDLFECIADEVPTFASPKRIRKAVDRSLTWLDEVQRRISQETKSRMLAVIGGGADRASRMRSVRETVKRDVAGFTLGGLGTGESREERGTIIDGVVTELPRDKVRVIHGLDLPEDVLDVVGRGIDMFSAHYPDRMAQLGYGLTFPLRPGQPSSAQSSGDPRKLNLRERSLERDPTAIVEHCACYTCQHHSRAYIHHLFNAHEMLGDVLLRIHNIHHYLGFFAAIREAIQEERFDAYRMDFWMLRRLPV